MRYGTAQMQLHTREVNTRVCAGLFTRGIKPNSSSRVNSLENLLNLVSIFSFQVIVLHWKVSLSNCR